MVYPAVMFLEIAIDQLAKMPPAQLVAHLKEFNELGSERMLQCLYGMQHPNGGPLKLTPSQVGYMIGIQTARVILLSNPELAKAGIDPTVVL